MVRFLAPEWLAALDEAGRDVSLAAPPDPPLVVEPRVTRPGGGVVCFHVSAGAGGLRVHAGAADDPDLVILLDRPTAVALTRGEDNVQRALAEGRCRLRGRPERVAAAAEAVTALGDVFASVRARTDFDHEPAADVSGSEHGRGADR